MFGRIVIVLVATTLSSAALGPGVASAWDGDWHGGGPWIMGDWGWHRGGPGGGYGYKGFGFGGFDYGRWTARGLCVPGRGYRHSCWRH